MGTVGTTSEMQQNVSTSAPQQVKLPGPPSGATMCCAAFAAPRAEMIHIALHFFVPLLVALAFYRSRWRNATVIMIAAMIVDVDHLLADPIYDPNRCSIGFHPLHTTPAIVIYAALFVLPLIVGRENDSKGLHPTARVLHLVGLGLLIHMTLDWIDCMI